MSGFDAIHAGFEAQALKTPEKTALVLGAHLLTYRELNERANQFAHFLRERGVVPGVFVGIYIERTFDLVVALLAILKAGGAYVPIDPQYPRERVAFMLQDSGTAVIVTDAACASQINAPGAYVVTLDTAWPDVALRSKFNLCHASQPDELAYVIYTSGSTGKPKGTLISHRNVLRLFSSTEPWFGFTQDDIWTLFHSCAFDFSVWEIWGALLYGGKLVIVPFDVSRTPAAFHRLLCQEKVTVLNQTPSAFRQLAWADEQAGSNHPLALRLVIFGGEALQLNSLRSWFERHGERIPRLVNMYGITETTVHVTYRPLGAADLTAGSVIGIPIPDLQIYLLDAEQQRVPHGECGEIYVGGPGVARGYLNRPELTAQRFVPDSFGADSSKRLYRSGDLARYLPNGDLEYLGRMDQQVKIRGFRIELDEISAAVNAHPGVADSVALMVDAPAAEKILVAYVVKRPTAQVSIQALKEMLRAQLPEYMVPSALVFLDRLPLTVNGKLDIPALPPPDLNRGMIGMSSTVGSRFERSVAAIWEDVLHVKSPGLEENFFDLGGNSIHIAEVHARLQHLLGRQFSITDLFAHSTIKSLAATLDPDAENITSTGDGSTRAERQRAALLARRNSRVVKN